MDWENLLNSWSALYYRPFTPDPEYKPEKTWYTFSGWTLSWHNEKFETIKQVTGPLILKANRTENTYTVKFDTWDIASEIPAITTWYTSVFELPTSWNYNISKTWYNFIWWTSKSWWLLEYDEGKIVSWMVKKNNWEIILLISIKNSY